MRCQHRVLQVEEFTELGVHLVCTSCGMTEHRDQNDLERLYIPFVHVAPSPLQDITLYIRKDMVIL